MRDGRIVKANFNKFTLFIEIETKKHIKITPQAERFAGILCCSVETK